MKEKPKKTYEEIYGVKMAKIMRKKRKQARLGKKLSEKTKEKIGEANKKWEHPKGNKHPCWKGGRIKHSNGYVLIHKPEHPFSDHHGYIPEHRLVMEAHLGRYLKKDEIPHHINGKKDDNRIENLELTTTKKHYKHHPKKRNKGKFIKEEENILKCPECNVELMSFTCRKCEEDVFGCCSCGDSFSSGDLINLKEKDKNEK